MGISFQVRDQFACYFLTFQVVGWVDIFSRKSYRDIVLEAMNYCRVNRSLTIYSYVIMTNHVHVIWQSKKGDLSGIIRDFKKHVSKEVIKEFRTSGEESRKSWLEIVFRYHAKYNKRVEEVQLWTHDNHAVELTSNEIFDQRLNYIHMNPVKAGWVERPEEYLYCSAVNYYKGKGLIEVDVEK